MGWGGFKALKPQNQQQLRAGEQLYQTGSPVSVVSRAQAKGRAGNRLKRHS